MNRSDFPAGVRAQLPILLGVAPFGLIYGVLAVGAGLPPSIAQAMSSIVFAGSSQFIGTNLFADNAPFVVIVLTTFVVNLRHALYSASLAPHLERLPLRWKMLFAYLLTDEAYATGILNYQKPDRSGDPWKRHSFYFGTALALWLTWQLSTGIGILFGAQVPASWALDFALPLTFIALVIPALADRPAVISAVVGATVAVAAYDWPYKLGLMAAALTGIIAGLIAEQYRTRPQ
ncbi:MAG: AzlC family ABC transporter permease [Chloroflexi bacterium]|nr:AzlC family ABC transporter permease [Chloroflexota bacterium]